MEFPLGLSRFVGADYRSEFLVDIKFNVGTGRAAFHLIPRMMMIDSLVKCPYVLVVEGSVEPDVHGFQNYVLLR